jgi:hypothetical protein
MCMKKFDCFWTLKQRQKNLSSSRRTSSKDGFLQKYENFSQVLKKNSKEFTLLLVEQIDLRNLERYCR